VGSFNLFATLQRGVGAGLAGIGISRQPEGVIPQVGHDVRERRHKKEAKARREPPAAPPASAPEPEPVAKGST
jgi:hypothetical protein